MIYCSGFRFSGFLPCLARHSGWHFGLDDVSRPLIRASGKRCGFLHLDQRWRLWLDHMIASSKGSCMPRKNLRPDARDAQWRAAAKDAAKPDNYVRVLAEAR